MCWWYWISPENREETGEMFWVMNTRWQRQRKGGKLWGSERQHWPGSSGCVCADVGVREPLRGGFTTQQPSDPAWASSSSPPLMPFLCFPPAALQHYNTTQKTKKQRKRRRRGGEGIFTKALQCLLLWMGLGDGGETACPTDVVAISPVFLSECSVSTSPWHFHCFLVLILFLYLNLYLLFRLLLNLCDIKMRKKTKKTPSVLKYCIAIVFNAKYYL